MTTGPTGKREESVQFSLKELLKLEDERIEEVHRDREAAEAAAARQRAEAEERERRAAEARERDEADANERRRRAEADDLARREAIQKAAAEQARLEVEVRARAEERELERRHELELARLRAEGKRSQAGALTGACLFGGVAAFVVMLGVHLGVAKPAEDRRVAELERATAAAESRAGDLGRRVDEQRRAIEDLETKLASADAELRVLRDHVARPPVAPARPGGRPPVAPAPIRAGEPSATTPCLKGDPMCPTIGR